MVIDGRRVGAGARCFLIAEAGVNHNGDQAIAHQLIDAAADAGADAVKFQTFGSLELDRAAYPSLIEHAGRRGVVFLSTPFDEQSADFLEELGLSAFKISSGDLTNLPMLAHVARKGRPMIVSTGMSDMDEVQAARRTIHDAGNRQLVLLHCVSNYPADARDANVRAMRAMAAATGVPVGFSDHTLGVEVSLAAVALGACMIEKHLTLDRKMAGPDHAASLEPRSWRALAQGVRIVEAALGDGEKRPAPSEADTARVARRSLVATQNLSAGTVITAAHIAVRRPGTGLAPAFGPTLLGRALRVPIAAGQLFTLEMLG